MHENAAEQVLRSLPDLRCKKYVADFEEGMKHILSSRTCCYILWINRFGSNLYSIMCLPNVLWFVFLLAYIISRDCFKCLPTPLSHSESRVWSPLAAVHHACFLPTLCVITAWWLTAVLCFSPRFLLCGLSFLPAKPEADLLEAVFFLQLASFTILKKLMLGY